MPLIRATKEAASKISLKKDLRKCPWLQVFLPAPRTNRSRNRSRKKTTHGSSFLTEKPTRDTCPKELT